MSTGLSNLGIKILSTEYLGQKASYKLQELDLSCCKFTSLVTAQALAQSLLIMPSLQVLTLRWMRLEGGFFRNLATGFPV
jgi:hypothetical protein